MSHFVSPKAAQDDAYAQYHKTHIDLYRQLLALTLSEDKTLFPLLHKCLSIDTFALAPKGSEAVALCVLCAFAHACSKERPLQTRKAHVPSKCPARM